MYSRAWSYFLYLWGLLLQALDPCSHPEPLPAKTLDRQQYLGQWYFQAAASRREADIQQFAALDSIVFTMEETADDTLLLTGRMRAGDSCMKQKWTYRLRPERDDLEVEGRPQRRNLLWTGTWINCPHCIIFQELEPPTNKTGSQDSLNRFLLYARQRDADADVVSTFLKKSSCHTMTASLVLPREKEPCPST